MGEGGELQLSEHPGALISRILSTDFGAIKIFEISHSESHDPDYSKRVERQGGPPETLFGFGFFHRGNQSDRFFPSI